MELLNKQKRLLVLDKNNRLEEVIEELQCYCDWEVVTVTDPQEVYAQARIYKPDLVLLNYSLLSVECISVCQHFNEDPDLNSVPVLVVTPGNSRKIRIDSLRCNALFIKPLDITVLAPRIDYLMAS